MNIGIKIRRLREQREMSQLELANLLGIEQGSLSKIESGKTERIDFLLMNKVCETFGVDFMYFLTDKNVTNNVETNNGVVYNDGVINHYFPEELKELLQQVVQQHQTQSRLIQELESKLKEKN